jgi:hypothetical protein
VEHSCEQCGALVEEGVVFCPKCNAPQIRVSLPEAPIVVPAAGEPLVYRPGIQESRIEWVQAFAAVGWAVLIASVLTLATVGSLGLGMLAAGALTVVFYRRRRPFLNLTAGLGARLGALAGAVGFGLAMLVLAVGILGFHEGPKIHDEVLKALQDYVAHHPAPQSDQVIEMFKTPDGFRLMVSFGLLFTMLACVAFSSVAGALSAWLFRRRNKT